MFGHGFSGLEWKWVPTSDDFSRLAVPFDQRGRGHGCAGLPRPAAPREVTGPILWRRS